MPDYRYERKYLTQDYGADDLERHLLLQPAFFKEIYYQRQINSIYFDTPEFDYYHLNAMGAFERKKVRVRWYEHDDEVSNLQIEIKNKAGELINKKTLSTNAKIHDLSIKNLTKGVRKTLRSYLSESVNLQPVMVNSYQRKYFFSKSTGMRVTIDSDLQFQSIDSWNHQRNFQRLPAVILECKYSVQDDPRLSKIAQGLPLLVTKSSKYILGMQSCYSH